MDFISQHTPNKKVHTTENDQEANASNLMNLTAHEDISDVARGGEPSQNLADQMTLFKPGGQIMPLTILPALPDSKSHLHLYICVINDVRIKAKNIL
jgi:hypothetical protein